MYKVGNCSLRGSYAGGFRAPTLKEMYMNFYMGNIFMIYGNPDLKPESSHNFSLSAEYMKGNHNLTVTGFYNIVDDRITTAWNQTLGGQVYTNMSRLQVAGIDANASGRYRCGISWRLSYAYTYEHIKKANRCFHRRAPIRQPPVSHMTRIGKLRFKCGFDRPLFVEIDHRCIYRDYFIRRDRETDLPGLYNLEIESGTTSLERYQYHIGSG